jgi:Na+-transporting methylmalonyl-CoA/oxaloacetate decarboxylase gamma subunit
LSEIGQGLSLSGIGILITFSALGILILLILLLKALFPGREKELVPVPTEKNPLSGIDPVREDLRKKAAAAGVAVLLSKRTFTGKGGLGSELEKPVGKWWQRGLDQIHGKERL